MSDIKYLEAARIIAADRGNAPPFHSAFGYGRKIPTGWRLLLDDGRTRRVYVCQYSNAGTAYVLIKKEWFFVGPDAETRMEDLNGLGIPVDPYKVDAFTRQYMETALWAEHDNSDESGGEPFDKNYGITDFAADTLAGMIADCAAFQRDNARDLQAAYESDVWIQGERYNASSAGHDFWLTRCGHGAGFWDRGLGDIGERLSEAARKCGNVDLYLGDIGKYKGKICS